MPASQRPTPEAELTPPTIHLSAGALERVLEMLREEDLLEEGGLRLSVHLGAGCSAPVQVGMVLEPHPEADDVILAGNGIRIFMDPRSAWSLDGLQVEYVDSAVMGSGFAFRHPRGAGGRSC